MTRELSEERPVFLSTLLAERGDRRLALGVVLASAAIFLAAAPFAKAPLAQVPAFLPIYQSALVINDLITSVLLFGQFGILRSRALLALASGYLFSASMAISHALSFPGLFAPAGLLGSGPQTTAWIYFLWHGGFPLFVIAYALLKDRGPIGTSGRPHGPTGIAIISGVAVVAGAGGLTLLATAGNGALPAIMQGDLDAQAKVFVAAATWIFSILALAVLWRRRPHSVLDVWAMVVMCVWIFDIALAAVLNHGRYDLGWYAGRVYGLLAASFVLVVLLLENGALYARLVDAHAAERRERRLVQQKTDELTAVNQELEAFSYSVSHDLRAPLRAVDGYARILEEDHADKLDPQARRLIGVVRAAAGKMGRLIDDLLAFSRLGRQPLKTVPVRLADLVNHVIDELRPEHAGRRIDFAVGDLGVAQADPALLKQVLLNLLGNAIKFTRERNPAVVEVGRIAGAHADAPSVYYVKDNGAGFDPRYAHKLFGVFQRLHGSDEFEGTGVGLAIVKRIIARHGGSVWAESKPGEGARFHFTLGPGSEGLRSAGGG